MPPPFYRLGASFSRRRLMASHAPLGERDVAAQVHVRMADVPVRELFGLTTQDGPRLVGYLAQRLHRLLWVSGSTE